MNWASFLNWYWKSFFGSVEKVSFERLHINALKFDISGFLDRCIAHWRYIDTIIIPLSNLGSAYILVVRPHAMTIHFVGILAVASSVLPFWAKFLILILFEFAVIFTIISVMWDSSLRRIGGEPSIYISIWLPICANLSSGPTCSLLRLPSFDFVEDVGPVQTWYIAGPRNAVARNSVWCHVISVTSACNELLL